MKFLTACIVATSILLNGCNNSSTSPEKSASKLTFMGKSMSVYNGEYCAALNAEVYINDADGSSPRLATLDEGVLDLDDVPENGFITTRELYDEGGSSGGNNPNYIYVVTSIQKEAISQDGMLFFEGYNNYDFILGQRCITLPIDDSSTTVVTNADEYPNTVTVSPDNGTPMYDGVPASLLGEEASFFTFSLNDVGNITGNSSYGVSNTETVTINKPVVTYPIVGDHEKISSYNSTLSVNDVLSRINTSHTSTSHSELYLPQEIDITSQMTAFRSEYSLDAKVWSEQRVVPKNGQFNVNFPSAQPIDSMTINDDDSISFITNNFRYNVIESELNGSNDITPYIINVFQVTKASKTIHVELPEPWALTDINRASITLYNFEDSKSLDLSIMAELRNSELVMIDPASSAIHDYNKAIMTESSVAGASVDL